MPHHSDVPLGSRRTLAGGILSAILACACGALIRSGAGGLRTPCGDVAMEVWEVGGLVGDWFLGGSFV